MSNRMRQLLLFAFCMALLVAAVLVFESTDTSDRVRRTRWGLAYRQYYALRSKVKEQVDAGLPPPRLPAPDEEATEGAPTIHPPSGAYASAVTPRPIGVALGARLHYTTDGSIPTRRSPVLPADLTLDATSVLRVRRAEAGGTLGETTTRFYRIGPPARRPVVSVTLDPVHLDGRYSGIRRHALAQGRRWERPAVVEYLDADGRTRGAIRARIRVSGGNSRKYRHVSFRILPADGEPTPESWLAPARPESSPRQTEWLLRHEETATWIFRDEIMQDLGREMGFAGCTQHPCTVHVNGERWGTYQLSERLNGHWLKRHAGVAAPALFTVKGSLGRPRGLAGDVKSWEEFWVWLADADLRRDEDYRRVATTIDLEALADYYLLEIYSTNQDWPHNNLLLYRDERGDRLWRPIVWDVDGAFSHRGLVEDRVEWSLRGRLRPDLKRLGGADRREWVDSTLLFRRLSVRPEFRDHVVARCDALLATWLRPQNMLETIDRYVAGMAPFRRDDAELWRGLATTAERLAAYAAHVESLRAFVRRRPVSFREQIRKHWGARQR